MDPTTKQLIVTFAAGRLQTLAASLAAILVAHGAIAPTDTEMVVQIIIGVASYGAVEFWGWYMEKGRAILAAQLARLQARVEAIPHVSAVPTSPEVETQVVATNAAISIAKTTATTAAALLVILALAGGDSRAAERRQYDAPHTKGVTTGPLPRRKSPPAAPKFDAPSAAWDTVPARKKQVPLKDAQTNPLLAIATFTVDDLTAALADANAQAPPDKTAAMCYSALIPIVQTGVANPLPSGLGAFQALQKARDAMALLAALQSTTGPLADLNIACAPLVVSVGNTLVQLGIVGGGVAASGGLVLPFSLPALFPLLGGLF